MTMTPILYKWVLACVTTITPVEVQTEIWSEHKYISHCHVAGTERSFDYPKQQCFCVERQDDK